MSILKIKLQFFVLISIGLCFVFLTGSALAGKSDVAYINSNNDAFVRSLYRSILDRNPDEGGVRTWMNWLESGKSRSWVITQFFQSKEYLNLNKSNVNYVRDLYQGVLGRQPDSGGLNHWVNYLKQGRSRSTVLNDFLNSREYRSILSRNHASKKDVPKMSGLLINKNGVKAERLKCS